MGRRGRGPHLLPSPRQADPTPDGAATIRLAGKEVRAFIEIDRGTERRLWLQAKFQRYLRHLAGRRGADEMHILFVVPDAAREATVRQVATSAFRWAPRPAPGVWITTNGLLAMHGPLGPVWARAIGLDERVPLMALSRDATANRPAPPAETFKEGEERRQVPSS